MLPARALLAACVSGIALFWGGCQTPDLKPFASATTSVAAGIVQGGDLALREMARAPAMVDDLVVAPGAENHPAKRIGAEWEIRRRGAEAILVYSSALAAIGDAAANRKANATELVKSVRQLAEAVPGVGVVSNVAGSVTVSLAGIGVEIKAWRDLGQAVRNADKAIAIVAEVFRADLQTMSNLHAGFHTKQISLARLAPEFRALDDLYKTLRKEQQARRDAVKAAPADAAPGNDLARLDALIAGVERDLNPRLALIARHRAALAEGTDFYQSAIRGVDAWAAAHRDLADAFTQKRAPNLALLLARAQEIQGLLQEIKSAKTQPATP